MHGGIRRGLRRFGALALVMMLLAVSLTPGASAAAKPTGPLDTTVLDWNRHAIEALINAPGAATPGLGQTPPVASLHLAMVQGTVYDAVNMIDRGYQPYLDNLPNAPRSASKAAAVATAAHDVLVGVTAQVPTNSTLTPAIIAGIVARIDGLRDATIAAAIAADGAPKVVKGIAAGEAAADAMLAERANDGRYVPLNPPLEGGNEPGEWRPLSGDPAASDPFAWVSQVRPFTLTSPSQFRTAGPHPLMSEAYTQEYNEVKSLGSATNSTRTAAQEALAQFYLTNPFEMFNRAFRTLAVERELSIVEQARLFAMLDLSVADSSINCWNDKVFWGFWRPITAIREGDKDGNPNTAGDSTWAPMAVVTPPYSDHVSGYNCVTAGFMYAAKAFFGTDEMAFSVTKAGTTDTRHFVRFSDVCIDTVNVRVYHGLHFRAADVQGETLGKNVAEWVAAHYFQPVKWNK